MTSAAAFFTEFLTTAILSMVVLALTDKRNNTLSPGLLPLALFLLFIGFGVSLGIQTGGCISHMFPSYVFLRTFLQLMLSTLPAILDRGCSS